MVGKRVLVYGLVFTLALTFAILPFIIPVYAAIEILKFDQLKIPKGHSDVITIIDSSAPHIISFEDFESETSTIWVNTLDDGVDRNCWKIDSLGTTTGKTGPDFGASGSTWYMYYESSTPSTQACAEQEDEEFLLGPVIDFDAFNNVEIIFSYHMKDVGLAWAGDDMGTLSLKIQDQNSNPPTFDDPAIWARDGHQDSQWIEDYTFDLSGYDNTGERQIMFVATDDHNPGMQSDMAIDEITIQGDAVALPSTVIASEDFENESITWHNTTGDNINNNNCWHRNSGETPTGNTGPDSGAVGTDSYMYYESSTGTGCADDLDQEFLLYDSVINFDLFSDVTIEFYVHMLDQGPWNNDDMGTLSLQLEEATSCSTPGIPPCSPSGIIISGDRTFATIPILDGNQGTEWIPIGPIDLSALASEGGLRQIKFVAKDDHTGIHSDMAVDEIVIRGATNGYTVSLQAADASGNLFPDRKINVPILKRDSNLYWQLVEFGDNTDETARELEVNMGEKVRVNFTGLPPEWANIVNPNDAITKWAIHDFDNQPADCNDPAQDLGGDIDEDGVCDDWEPTNGDPMIIDYPVVTPAKLALGYIPYTMNPTTGLVCDSFLQVDPANPVPCYGSDKRDIYVEIDYMVGHKPNLEALYKVITAFENAPASAPGKTPGIRLHIQLDENTAIGEIEHQDCIVFPGDNGSNFGFDQIRETYFGTDEEHSQAGQGKWGTLQKKQIFHYGLFVHTQCDPNSGSGSAEIPGNDLAVHLGYETGKIGNPDEQSGTFMHELGHNLGLHHGGKIPDEIGCKPNHLSVMNYARQFPILNADRSLDYSRQALGSPNHIDSLMETDLTEPLGIDIYNYNPNEGIVFGPIPPLHPPPTHDNINWNDNDVDDEIGPYQFDVNYFSGIKKCDVPLPTEDLKGYAEWDEGIMILNSRDSNPLEWANGRSAAAKFNPAVWEDGATDGPIILSQTCPSLKQVIDWADPKWLAKARNSTSTDHELAKEKIKAHLSNYRICEGGAGQSDTIELKKIYLQSLLLSVPNILEFYGEQPEQVIDDFLKHKDQTPSEFWEQILEIFATKTLDKVLQEKLQSHYTIVESTLVHHDNSLDTKSKDKLEDVKELIEFKANFFNVTLNHTSIEDVYEVQPIFASDELTTDSVKNMRALRANSTIQFLKNLDQSHFYEPKYDAIQYYMPLLNQTFSHVKNGSYANAAMVMASLDHAGKIKNVTTLEKLELATDTIIDQYTRAIPEFGTIASLILVASITCIIILTTKTRNIFMPKNYQ